MSASQSKKILVTSALPYANGPIHLGHLLEAIQTDIWVRLQKMLGRECHYVCADDAHGTPIMIYAQKQGITPEALIEETNVSHRQDYRDFLIHHDHYHSTHSDENQQLSESMYQKLYDAGYITEETIEQFFDEEANIFLPDRYVKGQCPKCGASDQYGDSCDVCSAVYSPTDLVEPYSVLSNTKPVLKTSEHVFFDLPKFCGFLQQWTQSGSLQDEVKNKLAEWFETGLAKWDITRDAPYFGFKIPGRDNQYFYVWLDAPIGYMASFKHYCESQGLNFDEFWSEDSDAELYHFIGKDVVYFHALFWPAMLEGSGFRKPNKVFAHGFLTVNGEKMSKSKGTFIKARDYLTHLDPEYLRYYFAAKLGSGLADIDLNFEDFVQKINSDLVGKVVNIASRTAGFIHKKFDGMLSEQLLDEALFNQFCDAGEEVRQLFEAREYNKAIRIIMGLADIANRFIDEHKPWQLIKEPGNEVMVQSVCTQGLNLFRVIAIYLKPVLPELAVKVENFLAVDALSWHDSTQPLLGKQINSFQALMQRIQRESIDALIQQSKHV